MAQRIPKGVMQREFAQKLIDKGKTRMQVVETLAEKMNMTKGYATTMVYRWFIGSEFKKSKPEIIQKPKAASKAKTEHVKPEKPGTPPAKKTKKDTPSKKSVAASRDVEGVDVFDASKKSPKKTEAEKTTKIVDDAVKAAKKTVAAKKKGKKANDWEFGD